MSANGPEDSPCVLDRVSALPGVKVASMTDWIPMTLSHKGEDAYPEAYVPHPHESLQVQRADVTPRYFETLHIPILEGREFTPDDNEKAPSVLIVDQTAARRYWPGQDPLGKKLRVVGVRRPFHGCRRREELDTYIRE